MSFFFFWLNSIQFKDDTILFIQDEIYISLNGELRMKSEPSFISLYRFHLFGIHILIVISQHACNFLTLNTYFSTYPVMTILQLSLFFLVDHPLILQL